MVTCKFMKKKKKKLFHTSSSIYFAFIFSEWITITSFEEALKVCELNFFHKIQAKSSVTLFNYDPSNSIFFMLNMAFDFVLSTVFVNEMIILRFLKYQDYNDILLFGLPVGFDMYLFNKNHSPSWR